MQEDWCCESNGVGCNCYQTLDPCAECPSQDCTGCPQHEDVGSVAEYRRYLRRNKHSHWRRPVFGSNDWGYDAPKPKWLDLPYWLRPIKYVPF